MFALLDDCNWVLNLKKSLPSITVSKYLCLYCQTSALSNFCTVKSLRCQTSALSNFPKQHLFRATTSLDRHIHLTHEGNYI